ncbi:MAG: hypothetical protein M3O70_03605, partial [Actinomycetota bacterium]|nr:hypothetical protein [Actinomycetota bacterium]
MASIERRHNDSERTPAPTPSPRYTGYHLYVNDRSRNALWPGAARERFRRSGAGHGIIDLYACHVRAYVTHNPVSDTVPGMRIGYARAFTRNEDLHANMRLSTPLAASGLSSRVERSVGLTSCDRCHATAEASAARRCV